jgi:membrane protease YdiL (CAAX protease family)
MMHTYGALVLLLAPHSYPTSSTEVGGVLGFVEKIKPFFPLVALPIIVSILWRLFRKTWLELDREANEARTESIKNQVFDTRPLTLFVMVALILAMQEYFGGRGFFEVNVKPMLEAYAERKVSAAQLLAPGIQIDPLGLRKYEQLWGYGWWVFTRSLGYVIVPFPVWKLLYPKDSLLDMGLRAKGFFKHFWIYGLFLAAVLPAMFVVSRSPDFGTYYPFYKESSRSWFDFLTWECMYFVQFFALEMFFRGFWLSALRKSLGSGAIFAMAVPYCMIHFGKPYLEAVGAIVAGIALGSLSMKTKSIYQGFLVHITVAGLMDYLALSHRGQLPHTFWPL